MRFLKGSKRADIIMTIIFAGLSIMLLFAPTGFEDRVRKEAVRCRGEIVEVDNSSIRQFGMVKTGEQAVKVKILDGPFHGKILSSGNTLLGQMDRDKIFAEGDIALMVLSLNSQGKIVYVNAQDHYRIGLELLLLGLFSLTLLIFAGWTGAKALLSFIFAGLMIWKVLAPGLLKGYDPTLLTLAVVAGLTGVIIFLVAGLTRRGLTAFLGAFLGVCATYVLSVIFTHELNLRGAVLPFAETLLYSGFGHLNLTKIYISAVFLAASGAVMDLAMDVSASMDEVANNNPGISAKDLILSGFSVGRVVVGTMTTTLLLAYSGGYITLLMAFMAQGVPLINLFNMVYVAAEVLKTIVGSFGLVLVAPFTALVGGLIFKGFNGDRTLGKV